MAWVSHPKQFIPPVAYLQIGELVIQRTFGDENVPLLAVGIAELFVKADPFGRLQNRLLQLIPTQPPPHVAALPTLGDIILRQLFPAMEGNKVQGMR